MHTSVSLALFTMRLAVALGCCFEGATNVSEAILGWSPDGGTIFTSGRKPLGALNATSGKQIWQAPNVSGPTVYHSTAVGEQDVWYSADGLHIAANCRYKSASDRISFCFFSTNDGKLMKIVNTSWHRKYGLWPMAISPDGKHLAGNDYHYPLVPWDMQRRYIRIWNADTGAIVAHLQQGGLDFLGGGDNIRVVAFHPDGKHLVSIGEDEFGDASGEVQGMVSLWDLGCISGMPWACTRIKLKDTRQGHGMKTTKTISFSPDGAYFATGSDDGVRIWDMAARTLVRRISAKGSWRIIWSPDGAKIATLFRCIYGFACSKRSNLTDPFNDARWYIHDVVTGDCLQDIPFKIADYLPGSTASWSPDGSYFAWQSFLPNEQSNWEKTGPIHITAFRSGNCTDPASQSHVTTGQQQRLAGPSFV